MTLASKHAVVPPVVKATTDPLVSAVFGDEMTALWLGSKFLKMSGEFVTAGSNPAPGGDTKNSLSP